MTPSIKTLRAHWDEETAAQLHGVLIGMIDPETFDPVERWIRQCFNRPNDTELQLAACDAILGTHGTEPIRVEGAWVDNYHFDIVATYCNTGDSYEATILYDTERDEFYVTSYGDWIEAAERTGRYTFD